MRKSYDREYALGRAEDTKKEIEYEITHSAFNRSQKHEYIKELIFYLLECW